MRHQSLMTNILIVDDDPLQASLMMSVLGRHFGSVRRVADAAEALCLIEESDFSENLGLVITGQHMTRVGGPAFVAELRSRKPDLPVLVLGAGGAAPSDYKDDRIVFLPRPVGGDKMLAVTSRLLAEHKNATV